MRKLESFTRHLQCMGFFGFFLYHSKKIILEKIQEYKRKM